MFKKLAAGAGVAALAVVMAAAPASAAPKNDSLPVNDGAYCVQQGIATLKGMGALQAAAKQQVDYSAFGTSGTGQIRLPLAPETYLPLGTVVALHASNPEYFEWCDR